MDPYQRVQEARTLEAMKNGYMGLGGKFCLIAKRLGFPIIRQGGLYSDCTEFADPYEFQETEETIRTMDDMEQTQEIGLHFDGLSRGSNISILVRFHLREIIVTNESNVVYKEVSGELENYAPQEKWQEKIEYFYNIAKGIDKEVKIRDKKENINKKEKQKNTILENLRKKWGI